MQKILSSLRYPAYYIPFLVLLYFLIPRTGHLYDIQCWMYWSTFIFQNKLSHVYDSGTDYLPLYHYFLFVFGKIQGSADLIASNIHLLKIVTILFEFGSTLILFWMLNEKFRDPFKAFTLSLFYLLNIAVVYNSIIWGQIDGILAFFVFASIILAMRKYVFWAMLCYILAINLKLQAIVFFPLFIGVLLAGIISSKPKDILLAVAGTGIIQLLILLPFLSVGDFEKVWNVVVGSAGKYPVVSMNAFNFWHLMMSGNLMVVPDSNTFAGIQYGRWGLLLFFASSFFALFFLAKAYYGYFFKKLALHISPEKVLIAGALIPLLFFFFNTQMHERYSHPAFIFLTAYALLFRRPLTLVIGSIAYLLNLEDVLKFLQWGSYGTLIFTPWFIALLYTCTICLLFVDLYRRPKEGRDSFVV